MKELGTSHQSLIAGFLLLIVCGLQPVTAAPETAGVNPDTRPADAPQISAFARPDNFYDKSLTGVVEPYPYSLRFLEDQEAWYTPFSRSGMLPPYDIRGWHGK